MPTPEFRNRPGNESLKNLWIEVCQAFEVQAGFAHLVFAELGQEFGLLSTLSHEIDDKFFASDCKAGEA